MTETDSVTHNGYDELRNRAHAYLEDHAGKVREEDLIRYIFGASTRPDLWRSLLTSVLGHDSRFHQTSNQTWTLVRNAIPASSSALSFVALDVETTGLRANQHRVIEIGMARYVNGRCVDRFSSLINPERRIPDYIRKLTGLTDSDLIPAPPFGQVADDVVSFIGELPVLGHNVGFDLAFVNAELQRLRRPNLENDSIDTIPMAMKVLGRTMRPSLDRVATALGMPTRAYHRALGDAELTAAIALRLLARAEEAGTPVESFLTSRKTKSVSRPPASSNAATLLDRALLETLPRRPGVYIMIDSGERVLYVGKAKSIRDRVGSYFSQPLGYTRKMDGLIEAISRIEHEETGSELVALLLESQLIRRHQPPYNRMLRNSETYPYITIDPANPWPRMRLAKKPRPDGAQYFGPYRSKGTARRAIDILNRRFRLRSCARGFKTKASYGNPCLELDLHRCDGPCVGRADADQYRAGVRQVVNLLGTDDRSMLDDIAAEIAEASEATQFERAQRLRGDLDILTRLHAEQRALAVLDLQSPCLIVQPSATDTMIQVLFVIRGRWWSQLTIAPSRHEEMATRLAAAWTRYLQNGLGDIDHLGVDEANIIARWRASRDASPYVLELELDAELDWSGIAARIEGIASRPFSAEADGSPIQLESTDHPLVVANDIDAWQIPSD